jgi:hypothetical protein
VTRATVDPAPKSAISASQNIVLKVSNMVVKDLANTGNFLDKQDPCLKITVGTMAPFVTKRIQDAGVEAAFVDEYFECSISHDDFKAGINVSFLFLFLSKQLCNRICPASQLPCIINIPSFLDISHFDTGIIFSD